MYVPFSLCLNILVIEMFLVSHSTDGEDDKMSAVITSSTSLQLPSAQSSTFSCSFHGLTGSRSGVTVLTDCYLRVHQLTTNSCEEKLK